MASHGASMGEDHAHHAALTRALAMENRAEDRARDQYRHPFETLDFFEVKPGKHGNGLWSILEVPEGTAFSVHFRK